MDTKSTKNFITEFKDFISKGNVIEFAVAIVMGASFTTIVQSLVNDVITPLLGMFLGGIDLSGLSISLGHAVIRYGSFIQACINFFLISFVIFIIIKAINKVEYKIKHDLLEIEEEQEKEEKDISAEVKELREIKALLKNTTISQKFFK